MKKYLTYFIVAMAITLVYSFENILNDQFSLGSLVEELIGFILLLAGFVLAGGTVEKILLRIDQRWGWSEKPIQRFLSDLFGAGVLTIIATVLIVLGAWAFFESFGIPKNMDRKEQTMSKNEERKITQERPGPPREGRLHPPPGRNNKHQLPRLPLGIKNRNFAEAYKYGPHILLASFILFFVVFLFEESRLHSKRSEIEKFKAMQISQDQMISRINALKGQINPHFMFNNLNTLSGLIHEDVNRADQFIQSLSKNLRYVLEQNEEILVPLEKELEFIESYIHLQEERFGHKLKIKVNVEEEDLNFELPALTLELLVENALKHNIVSSAKPLNILIEVKGNNLIVSNNFQPKKEDVISTGIGLKNLREQLSLLGLDGASFGVESNRYIAKIPMLRIPKINSLA